MGDIEIGAPASMESPLKYHPDCSGCLTDDVGTLSGGEFDWGGLLPKSNGGVRRYTHHGRKSWNAYKGRSVLDCEPDGASRDESRS